jgi:DDE family transposase
MTTRSTGNLDTVPRAARVREPNDLLKLMRNSVNREHGPYRRPVGGARSTVPAAAAVRWAWAILVRSAESLSTLIRPVIAAFQHWQRSGLLLRLLQKLAEDLRDRGKLDLSEAFVDASFSSAKERGSAIGPTRRGKGSKIMAISDGHGLPLAVHVASASPHETRLVEATRENRFFADLPERLIGDHAYDSDPLVSSSLTARRQPPGDCYP